MLIPTETPAPIPAEELQPKPGMNKDRIIYWLKAARGLVPAGLVLGVVAFLSSCSGQVEATPSSLPPTGTTPEPSKADLTQIPVSAQPLVEALSKPPTVTPTPWKIEVDSQVTASTVKIKKGANPDAPKITVITPRAKDPDKPVNIVPPATPGITINIDSGESQRTANNQGLKIKPITPEPEKTQPSQSTAINATPSPNKISVSGEENDPKIITNGDSQINESPNIGQEQSGKPTAESKWVKDWPANTIIPLKDWWEIVKNYVSFTEKATTFAPEKVAEFYRIIEKGSLVINRKPNFPLPESTIVEGYCLDQLQELEVSGGAIVDGRIYDFIPKNATNGGDKDCEIFLLGDKN